MFGAITQQIDAVEVLVIAFFVFLSGLIYYLRREDKREGYPLDDSGSRRGRIEGFPPAPPPKFFRLLEGGTTAMPHEHPATPIAAEPLGASPGAPLIPLGDTLRSELGPAAYPRRRNEPMFVLGEPQLRPLAQAHGWKIADGDPDPRGMQVVDAERAEVGVVREIWIDRGAKILRYLEVSRESGASNPLETERLATDRALVPIYYADIDARRRVIRVRTLLAREFDDVPRPARSDQITAREEDHLNAFYAGATLYGGARRRRVSTRMRPVKPWRAR